MCIMEHPALVKKREVNQNFKNLLPPSVRIICTLTIQNTLYISLTIVKPRIFMENQFCIGHELQSN